MTTVGSEVKFSFPYLHPDTKMRSNQGPDWDHVINYATKQLYMKATMKIFGARGVNVVSNELKQLNLQNTFEPLYLHTLRKEEYNEALESHLFLKIKETKI